MESLLKRSFDIIAFEEQRKKKMVFGIILVISVIIIIIVGIAVYDWHLNMHYKDYKITASINIKDSASLEYAAGEDSVIRYGRDGITAINRKGEDIWAGSYEMTNPRLNVCGDSAVVADIGGTSLYAYRGRDTGVNFSVDYPIVEACVSEQGVVAVLVEESSSNTIAIYNPFAKTTKLLVEIPTNVEEGYPVSVDISPDGTSVVAAYLCVTTGTAQSRVAFYNFTDIGKNANCLVGAQNYDDTIVADVEFFDEDHVCLFSEKGFYIWENMKQPKLRAKKEISQTIRSAFMDQKRVGVITDRSDGKEDLRLYDLDGDQELHLVIEAGYTSVQLAGDEILLNSDSKCAIYRLNGIKKYASELKNRISYLFKGNSRNCYLFIQNSKIKLIKLCN